jgi:hypothetical protein
MADTAKLVAVNSLKPPPSELCSPFKPLVAPLVRASSNAEKRPNITLYLKKEGCHIERSKAAPCEVEISPCILEKIPPRSR